VTPYVRNARSVRPQSGLNGSDRSGWLKPACGPRKHGRTLVRPAPSAPATTVLQRSAMEAGVPKRSLPCVQCDIWPVRRTGRMVPRRRSDVDPLRRQVPLFAKLIILLWDCEIAESHYGIGSDLWFTVIPPITVLFSNDQR
jgi:hypothetical protein